ncbi:restriction endonuclease subunit S [Helicobacter pylori]|uniref:restriction endonuclease subunit S n=1 Tax=Helicobacter pylori TaxID=210 RepID=UPI001FD63E9C|nr:restriction endonuclease subunit S [Helicobacter pylori]UOS15135.1 restriction endonuclease subunit S [Helicobacter pylori]
MDALMLPLNWQRVRLGDIGKPCMCKRVMKHQTTRYGEIPFYKIGTFGNTADAFISKKLFLEYKTKYSFPKKGDVLISASGTIGRAVIYDGKPAYFQDSNIVWIDNDETLVKNDFLFYAYSNVKWNTEHTIILRLYNDNFRNTLIPLPPLNEQSAIANILSDLDRYLYALDALILKKEGVKKALSFELLNQIKRLKGFNQAWQRVRLGDIANYVTSNLSAEQITQQGKIKVYDVNNFIGYTDTTFISDKPYISIVKDGSVGRVRILPPKTNILSTMGALIANHRTTTEFLFYLLSNFDFKNFTSGSIIPHIYFKDYKEKTIFLPPLNEQSAIANILSALDNEIASLKNKKHQFENIKKALNHDLMSAKIRVLKKTKIKPKNAF